MLNGTIEDYGDFAAELRSGIAVYIISDADRATPYVDIEIAETVSE
jgi:hypothetical protein